MDIERRLLRVARALDHFASKMVKNPNPKGRKKMVTEEYAQKWLAENKGSSRDETTRDEHIKGLRGWAADLEKVKQMGNEGLAQEIKRNIDKAIKEQGIDPKEVYGDGKAKKAPSKKPQPEWASDPSKVEHFGRMVRNMQKSHVKDMGEGIKTRADREGIPEEFKNKYMGLMKDVRALKKLDADDPADVNEFLLRWKDLKDDVNIIDDELEEWYEQEEDED